MKRRELLKGLSIVAGGALCGKPALAALSLDPGDAPIATPIRGIIRKDSKPHQPIEITLPHSAGDVIVVTSLDGVEIDRRTPGAGAQSFRVFASAVDEPKEVSVTIAAGDNKHSLTVKLQPVHKVLIYVLPHSHHDLGYTNLQAEVEEKQMNNIAMGIELAAKTASYPQGARFVWNLEVLWGADLFMRRKSEVEKKQLVDAVKKGWVSLNGMYANELTGLCRPEELLQLFRYSKELGAQCGVTVDAAMQSDVPGFTWGTVTAMAQAGIRYFSLAPNWFDRVGTLMLEWQDKPFWALSPSRKEKVLVWISWTGYGISHVMKKMDAEFAGKYQDRLDAVKYPYDISYIRWSGHGDNAEPDPQICEFVRDWNSEYEWPKFAISSTSEAFSAFEERHGKDLPALHGDLTPYWEDGAGSSALETKMNRNAADRLTQAEALGAMLSPGMPRGVDANEVWRNILLYSEHTWGAATSVSDSENGRTRKQWDFKRDFAVKAEKLSSDLLADVLRASGVGDAAAVDVVNSASWPRTEVVMLSAAMSLTGDRVNDAHGTAIPSQRLATGELAFLAHEVPAFGSARFHLSPGHPHASAKRVQFKDGVLDNGVVRVKIDATSGNITALTRSGESRNLVDSSQGETLNEYLFLAGSDIAKIQTSGPARIGVEEDGPLMVSVRIESDAPGCNSLTRHVRMIAGADYVELTNVVDKKRGPMNPEPGKGGAGGEFAQRGGKESVQFAFPFAIPDGTLRMDVPLAEMRPEADQLPGASKNWLPVGRWIDVSNAQHGVTWVTLDAPLVEIGTVSAKLLGSQRDTKVWREHIASTQKFYSWVMNNHWGTNYRAYQEGVVAFRYALRPHSGYDAAAASRFAIGLSQPLLATTASADTTKSSMLHIDPPDVLAITLKSSEDGKSSIVRLFGASGEDRQAKVIWPSAKLPKLWLSDLSERRISAIDGEIAVAGWDMVTVRIDRA